ncbi:hypothetical protein N8198_09385 [Gammaproteobacteria bacterium]|nr:hypothetical protein [Gammaproteobacteria bacterium]
MEFVIGGINRSSAWADLKHQIYLGDEHFIKGVQSLIDANKDLRQIPSTPSRLQAKLLHDYPGLENDLDQASAGANQSVG